MTTSGVPNKRPISPTHEEAVQIISQLIENKEKITLRDWGQTFTAEEAYQLLITYLTGPFFSDILPFLPEDQQQIKEINPQTLEILRKAIFSFLDSQKQRETLERAFIPPVSQIREWQEELAAWQQRYQQLPQEKQSELPPWQTLEEQIKLIQRFQARIKTATALVLSQQAPYLSEEEKNSLAEIVSFNITQAVANRLQKIISSYPESTPTELEAKVKETLHSQADPIINQSWHSLRQENPSLPPLPPPSLPILRQAITGFFQPDPKQPARIPPTPLRFIQDYSQSSAAKTQIAPPRKEIKKLVASVLNLSPKETEKIVCRMEIYLSSSPSSSKEDIRRAFERSLPFPVKVKIARDKTAAQQINSILFPLSCYQQAMAASSLQPTANFFIPPVTLQSVRWSRKLKQRGLDITPLAIAAFLKGVTAQQLAEKKIPPFLEEVREGLKILEKNFGLLPSSFRRKVTLSRWRAKFFGFFESNSPFFSIFNHPPFFEEFSRKQKIQWLQSLNDYLKKTKKGTQGVFQKFYHWRLRFGNNLNLFAQKLGVATVISQLKSQYWLKRGVSGFFIWLGKRFGEKTAGVLFRKAGEILLKEGFKSLASRGLAYLLGSVLGLSTVGIGTILTIGVAALDFLRGTLHFFSSPEGRQLLQNIAKKAAAVLAALLFLVIKFISHFIFTFALGLLGFLLGGPVGLLLGGATGLVVDLLRHSFGSMLDLTSQKIGAFLDSLANSLIHSLTSSSFITSTALVSIGTPILTMGVFNFLHHASRSSAFIASPTQEMLSLESKYLIITKKATPQINVDKNTNLTYTISLDLTTDKLINIKIEDRIDLTNLEVLNVESGGNFNPEKGTITWQIATLEGKGSRLILTYQAQTKPHVTPETKITNKVSVSAFLEDGTEVTKTTSVTLNSSGDDIAQRALAIVNNLQPGFWNYYNYSPDYPDLFNWEEYACCPNHCYRSTKYPPGCTGDPSKIATGNAMFWCSWLVVKSYNESGFSMPAVLAVESMKEWFESNGTFLPANTDVSQLELGDAIMFTAPSIESPGTTYWAHVGIICNLDYRNDYITVCESNNYAPIINYTVSGGRVQGQGRLTVGGFGRLW